MTEETQAETFIRILTEVWNEDRDWKECQQERRLKASLRRFVDEFRVETGRGRFAHVPPKTGTLRGQMPKRRSQPNDTAHSFPFPHHTIME